MDVLSTAGGSAQAVREAAQGSNGADGALALERELDRLNAALAAHAGASAQHLQWMLLAQALLLASYLVVLIGGWALPLPGKRWLLAAIAAYGAVALALGYLSQRGARDRISPLRQAQLRVEQALERIALRPVVFSRNGVLARSAGDWATALLPVALLAGWIALSVYTLALPLPTDARQASSAESRAAPRPATAAASAAARSKASPSKGEEPAPGVTTSETPAAGQTGLAALFRRAINAPPADTTDPVKP
jgi:hypothetical protein